MSVVSPFKNGGSLEDLWRIYGGSAESRLFRHAALTVLALVTAATDVDPTSVAFCFENQLVEPAMLLDEEEPLLESGELRVES